MCYFAAEEEKSERMRKSLPGIAKKTFFCFLQGCSSKYLSSAHAIWPITARLGFFQSPWSCDWLIRSSNQLLAAESYTVEHVDKNIHSTWQLVKLSENQDK